MTGSVDWEKDLKKVQQREQQMLKKLAEARERQARAMNRFALAQARISLAEERLHAFHERFKPAQEISEPGDDRPVVPSPSEARQDSEDEEAMIAAILAITQTESTSLLPATNAAPGETERAVEQAEHALQEVKQAILHGTLSGPEAENAQREAENALFQAQRAEIETDTDLEADTSSAQDTSETDATARLPIIRRRRSQESR